MSLSPKGGMATNLASIVTAFSLAVTAPLAALAAQPVQEQAATNVATTSAPAAGPQVGQCASSALVESYLDSRGEKPILEMDRVQRVGTPFGMQQIKSTVSMNADEDSWSLIAQQGPNKCIVARGDTLNFVSAGDSNIVSASLSNAATRADTIQGLVKNSGAQVFLTAKDENGGNLDFLTNLQGAWSIVQSNSASDSAEMTMTGSEYRIQTEAFYERFDLFNQHQKHSIAAGPSTNEMKMEL